METGIVQNQNGVGLTDELEKEQKSPLRAGADEVQSAFPAS